jgi:hypothetical protein
MESKFSLAILLASFVASIVGILKYEHIDTSFWKALALSVFPVFAAAFISWHVKLNRFKKGYFGGYSLVPGTIAAIVLAGIVCLPFSGLVLLINAIYSSPINSEKTILEAKWITGKGGQHHKIQMSGIQSSNKYVIEVERDLYSMLQEKQCYLLDFRIGILKVKYWDKTTSLRRISCFKP